MNKKNPILVAVMASCLTLASQASFGSGREGGGGAAVVCRDRGTNKILSIEMLDVFEAKLRKPGAIFISSPDGALGILKTVVDQSELNTGLKHMLRHYINETVSQLDILPPGIAYNGPPEDLTSGSPPLVKEGCVLEAVGYYSDLDGGKLKVT